jgi:hypothetical protein
MRRYSVAKARTVLKDKKDYLLLQWHSLGPLEDSLLLGPTYVVFSHKRIIQAQASNVQY